MQENFEIKANSREAGGTSANRRLRRSGRVPGDIYGGGKEPQMISVDKNELVWHLDHEAFYSSVLTLDLDGKRSGEVVLKDMQRHPANSQPTHVDLLRIKADQAIRMTVPVHFMGEDVAPGVKEGGMVSHLMTELDVECLPKDLPEYIEVDISGMSLGDTITLSNVKLPEGVAAVMLISTEEMDAEALAEFDPAVVAVSQPSSKAAPEEEEVEASAVPTVGEEEGGS